MTTVSRRLCCTQALGRYFVAAVPYVPSPPFASLTDPPLPYTTLQGSSTANEGGLKEKTAFRLFLVDPERFELSTFSMPLRRAPNCAMGPCLLYSFVFHGAPNSPGRGLRALWALNKISQMDLEGFEPSTSSVRLKRAPNCATGPYSIQISRLNILPF